ncbi:8357_t:CDS:1 [Paraglomus brasilianum]|uniref:8357_t:CDS:1 n=1 Tax=Paraglomus brasilianum TaxID=144538 RepID=A0A9N9BFS9_9GLOM|nr:8357_t:CDS:1 [Paraglomus brasilianum]
MKMFRWPFYALKSCKRSIPKTEILSKIIPTPHRLQCKYYRTLGRPSARPVGSFSQMPTNNMEVSFIVEPTMEMASRENMLKAFKSWCEDVGVADRYSDMNEEELITFAYRLDEFTDALREPFYQRAWKIYETIRKDPRNLSRIPRAYFVVLRNRLKYFLNSKSTAYNLVTLFDDMREANIRFTDRDYNWYMKAWLDLKYPRNAILVFHKMRPNTSFDIVAYNHLIEAYLQLEDLNSAEKVLKKIGDAANEFTYTLLITGCNKARDSERARTIYQLMTSKEIDMDTKGYDSIIQSFASVNDVRMAAIVYLDMVAKGKEPTIATMSILFRNLPLATSVFKEELEKLNEPRKRRSDPRIYFSILHQLVKFFQTEVAESMFESMLHSDLDKRMLYVTMIQAFSHSKDITKALVWLDKMYFSGLRPDIKLYNEMLSTAVDLFNVRVVAEILRRLQTERVNPDSYTYNMLLALNVRMKNYNAAAIIYKTLELMPDLNVDIFTIASLFTAIDNRARRLVQYDRRTLILAREAKLYENETILYQLIRSRLPQMDILISEATSSLEPVVFDRLVPRQLISSLLHTSSIRPRLPACNVILRSFIRQQDFPATLVIYDIMTKYYHMRPSLKTSEVIILGVHRITRTGGFSSGLRKLMELLEAAVGDEAVEMEDGMITKVHRVDGLRRILLECCLQQGKSMLSEDQSSEFDKVKIMAEQKWQEAKVDMGADELLKHVSFEDNSLPPEEKSVITVNDMMDVVNQLEREESGFLEKDVYEEEEKLANANSVEKSPNIDDEYAEDKLFDTQCVTETRGNFAETSQGM